jgi:DNA polymerase III subunit beta
MLKQGNITLISRLITLDFAPYKNILEYLETPNTLRVNTEDLTNALTELLPIAKDNENALNSAIFKVENNKLTISAISSTMKKELDMICLCNLDKFKISLNIKWLLDYIKTSDKIEVEIQFKDDSSGLMINNEYLAMPLAMREE